MDPAPMLLVALYLPPPYEVAHQFASGHSHESRLPLYQPEGGPRSRLEPRNLFPSRPGTWRGVIFVTRGRTSAKSRSTSLRETLSKACVSSFGQAGSFRIPAWDWRKSAGAADAAFTA